MTENHPVQSGHKLSIRAFELMQNSDPKNYGEDVRGLIVREINDTLQGRSETTVESLLARLIEKGAASNPEAAEHLCRDILAFETQKSLVSKPYRKTSDARYYYVRWKPESCLKYIDQELFDEAAASGFPSKFFQNSYFDNVTIYCLPDHADLTNSRFQDCAFAVCRIMNANFDYATFQHTEFYTSEIQGTSFLDASISNTYFNDCSLSVVSFQMASMRHCSFRDCTMARVNFLCTTLDGCHFERIQASDILNLATMSITMGGATDAECRRNRASVYKALSNNHTALTNVEPKHRDRHSHEER